MLEEYKSELLNIVAFLTIARALAGGTIARKIYHAKSAKNVSAMPFIAGCTIAVLIYRQSLFIEDVYIGLINIVCFIINAVFLAFYFYWSDEITSKAALRQIGIAALVVSIFLGYTVVEDPSLVKPRYGLALATVLISLFALPLLRIKTIIQSKNTDSISFALVAFGSCMSFAWVLYGLAAHLKFLVIVHSILLSINFTQMILCLIYPSKKADSKSKDS